MFKLYFLTVSIILVFASGAHADAGHGPKIGSPANLTDANRTIEIDMTDNRYNVDRIDVKKGDVVHFIIHNKGQLVHEFNIGSPGMHAVHRDEMQAMMQSGQMTPTMMHGGSGMGHHDPNSVLLNPGETKELVWRFDHSVDGLEFACNVPGHYQAGMVGKFQMK